MKTGSFFTLRRAIVTGAVTMLAVTGAPPVQAQERVADGWLPSVIAETASDAPGDGWLPSVIAETERDPSGTESVASGDGWLPSVIAGTAPNIAPEIQVAATSSEFPTEIAVGSSLLTLTLMGAGIVVLLRRRHASIAA